MKKNLITILLTLLIGLVSIIPMACKDKTDILIVSPDGAPALAISQMMYNKENFGENVTYKIINSENVTNYVPKQADIAIVPINAATKLCGDNYKIVAVNTHGNLYMLGKETISNLSSLVGKKVAVIQYANVPGLTFRAILSGNNVAYTQIANVNDNIETNKVNIYGCDPSEVAQLLSSGKVDYALSAEPSVSLLVKNLSAKNIKVCLNLQETYYQTFNENFPQAVTIVKNSLIENNNEFVKKFIKALKQNDEFIKVENVSKILEGIKANLEEGYATSLDATKLSENALKNSNVKYEDAYLAKDQILLYIKNIKAIDNTKISDINDEIFVNLAD